MILQSTHSAPFPIEHQHYSGMCTARDAQQYTQQETSGQITCDDLFTYHRRTDDFVLSNEQRWTHNFSLYNTKSDQLQKSTLNLKPRQTDSLHTHTHTLAHTGTCWHTHTHTKPRQTARQTGRQTDRCMHMSMNLYDASMWTLHNDQKWYRHRHRYRHRFMCKHKYRTSTAET